MSGLRYAGPSSSTTAPQSLGVGRKATAIKPGDALHNWRRWYSMRNLRAISVGILGDSISFGSGATTFDRTFARKLGHRLNGVPEFAVNESVGDADIFSVGGGYHLRSANNSSAPDPWVRSTSPAPGLVSRGTGGQAVSLGFSSVSASISYTAKSSTGFVIAYEDGTGAVMPKFTITGKSGQILSVNTPTINSGLAANSRSVFGTFLPRGTYTVKCENSTSAGTAVVDGMYVMDGDGNSGVVVMNHAFPGFTTDTYTNGTTQATTMKACVSTMFNPDMFILNLGANDYMNGVNPSTFQTNLGSIISAYRTQIGNSNASFLIVAWFARYDITSPAFPWSQYVAAIKAVAAATSGVEFLDMTSFFAATQTADNADWDMVDTSGVHMSDRGHGLYSQLVADRLLVPWGVT